MMMCRNAREWKQCHSLLAHAVLSTLHQSLEYRMDPIQSNENRVPNFAEGSGRRLFCRRHGWIARKQPHLPARRPVFAAYVRWTAWCDDSSCYQLHSINLYPTSQQLSVHYTLLQWLTSLQATTRLSLRLRDATPVADCIMLSPICWRGSAPTSSL